MAPVMKSEHVGSIYELAATPTCIVSVPASSDALVIIYPAFSTVAQIYTRTAGVVAAAINVTPSFCTSAAAACSAGGSMTNTHSLSSRWADLCTSVVCTTPLANIGQPIYAKRLMDPVDKPNSNTTFTNVVASVTVSSEARSAGDFVSGQCIQSTINSNKAFYFGSVSESLYNAANSPGTWEGICYNTITGQPSDVSELNWKPIVIYIDNTASSLSALTFVFEFDLKVQYLPTPTSFLSASKKRLPHGSNSALLNFMEKAEAHEFVPRRGPYALDRNTTGWLGTKEAPKPSQKSRKPKQKNAEPRRKPKGWYDDVKPMLDKAKDELRRAAGRAVGQAIRNGPAVAAALMGRRAKNGQARIRNA